ncbi:Phage integrase family protein [Desulfatibacillum alkenivorans DSM 16219]|jgi:integrase|uniref:Phage integrase family protein n=1 Tax=Desulfatibacillum alkenivorans DSM 16219 TaxID=1121393 RepID=A0A1M6Q9G9_9BACT|nr:tyrosine-type recombinase/integrase [Desulfatibacillum alkenivorans]SHK16733.1 Phage integrase family protein [Desulfatibacillum alkenivorans DSM 16219]
MDKNTRNPNHPKKGSRIRVDPIRNEADINAIKKLLADNPRDLLLFTIGINNGLRAGDLLKLKVAQVRKLKPGQTITIIESKTGKENILMVNKAVAKAIKAYMDQAAPGDHDYLFPSRKTGQALTVQAVNALVKKWTRAINLDGNYGSHTLRKTFGFMQRVKYGVGFELLAKRFNHSNPSITMRYLGLSSEEVVDVLMNEI